MWVWSWKRESWSHHQGKTEVRGVDELVPNEGRLLGEEGEESHLHGCRRGGTRKEGAKKGGGRENIIRGRRENHQQWGRWNQGEKPISKLGKRVWAEEMSQIHSAKSCRELAGSTDSIYKTALLGKSFRRLAGAEICSNAVYCMCRHPPGPISMASARLGERDQSKHANPCEACWTFVSDPGVLCLTHFQETHRKTSRGKSQPLHSS